MLGVFNYLPFVEVSEEDKKQQVIRREMERNIGKIFHFLAVLYRNYQLKFEDVFNQTLNTICMLDDVENGRNYDNVINKTALFCQDVVYKRLTGSRERFGSHEKSIVKDLKTKNSNEEEKESLLEKEQRLKNVVPF